MGTKDYGSQSFNPTSPMRPAPVKKAVVPTRPPTSPIAPVRPTAKPIVAKVPGPGLPNPTKVPAPIRPPTSPMSPMAKPAAPYTAQVTPGVWKTK